MLPNVSLQIGILVERRDQIRDKEVLSLGVLREILSEWGGVYIRYKGIRITPYGGNGDDWLGIDRDRGLRKGSSNNPDIIEIAKSLKGITPNRYLLQLLSSRAYVGDVDIPSDLNGFSIKASREGFLSSEAFSQLVDFTRFAVDYATMYRDLHVRNEEEKAHKQAIEIFNSSLKNSINTNDNASSLSAIAFLRNEIQTIVDHVPEKERKAVVDSMARATDVIEKKVERDESALRHLRLVASTSILLSIFSHDVRVYLSDIESIKLSLIDLTSKYPQIKESVTSSISIINNHYERLSHLVDMTLSVAAPGVKQEEIKLSLKPRLQNTLDCFNVLCAKYGIVIDINDVPEIVHIGPMFESELYALFLNIISNAIKAVVSNDGLCKKIKIDARKDGDKCLIVCKDSGSGVDLTNVEELFKPYIADPNGMFYASLNNNIDQEDSFILGTGNGLGLSIIKNIVDRKNGEIKFVKPCKPWKTELRIKI